VATSLQAVGNVPAIDHEVHHLPRRLIDRFGIVVIFVTGNPGEVGLGLDGSVDIVGKPFTDTRILESLKKAVTAWKRGARRLSTL